jgi:catechol 2,3-dioxygenase-like lactoylglutathione lyase family enzyme
MKTMAIRLNHTIVAARDKIASANFLTEILGLSPALLVGPFAVIQVGDTSLDYMNVEEYRSSADGDITSQHYAFLVTEAEFDEIFERIRKRGLPYWADPARHESDQINTCDGGRGVYFQAPNGHLLEIITRPYGSGGTKTARRHPLFAAQDNHEARRSGDRRKTDGDMAAADRADQRE